MGNSKKKETKIFCGNGMIYCLFHDLPNYDDLLIHTIFFAIINHERISTF